MCRAVTDVSLTSLYNKPMNVLYWSRRARRDGAFRKWEQVIKHPDRNEQRVRHFFHFLSQRFN